MAATSPRTRSVTTPLNNPNRLFIFSAPSRVDPIDLIVAATCEHGVNAVRRCREGSARGRTARWRPGPAALGEVFEPAALHDDHPRAEQRRIRVEQGDQVKQATVSREA